MSVQLFKKVEAKQSFKKGGAPLEISISCTFGPVAENGTGKNQKIGTDLEHGFTKEDLLEGKRKIPPPFLKKVGGCELHPPTHTVSHALLHCVSFEYCIYCTFVFACNTNIH